MRKLEDVGHEREDHVRHTTAVQGLRTVCSSMPAQVVVVEDVEGLVDGGQSGDVGVLQVEVDAVHLKLHDGHIGVGHGDELRHAAVALEEGVKGSEEVLAGDVLRTQAQRVDVSAGPVYTQTEGAEGVQLGLHSGGVGEAVVGGGGGGVGRSGGGGRVA